MCFLQGKISLYNWQLRLSVVSLELMYWYLTICDSPNALDILYNWRDSDLRYVLLFIPLILDNGVTEHCPNLTFKAHLCRASQSRVRFCNYVPNIGWSCCKTDDEGQDSKRCEPHGWCRLVDDQFNFVELYVPLFLHRFLTVL